MNLLTPYKPYNKEAIIIAEGPSKDKILESPEFAEDRDVAVVNRAGLWYPHPVRYWITYHAEWLSRWWADRELNKHPLPHMAIVSANTRAKIDHIPHYNITVQTEGLNSGGTSSILAAMVLLDMGYDPIHLFGVDLTKSYGKERKFWRILKGQPLIFHGADWFHTGLFREEKK